MELRNYQKEVIKKIMWAKNLEGNDIICVAQGGGKSHIIAELAHRLNPVIVICPTKEVLEQNISKMEEYMPREEIGVFSASMNEKTIKNITFGTIQSMYKVPEKFKGFEIVIYDECDLHNPKKLNGMSNKLLKQAGISKVFGFTGTPFRQDAYYKYPTGYRGLIWQKAQIEAITTTKMINRYKGYFWKRMLCVINTHELTENGYLTPLKYHDLEMFDHKQIPTNKSKSDFDLKEFDTMITDRHLELSKKIENLPHKAKIVFCSTIEQAQNLSSITPNSAVITSKTTKKVRAETIKELKAGKLKILYNVGIYTVGFDYPELDCIVLLRPTRSLRLHCQILGRVSRIAEGKEFGHVYDFVSNVKNMGRLEEIRIEKVANDKGTMLWNVTSPAYPQGFHNEPLYKYKLKRKEPQSMLI